MGGDFALRGKHLVMPEDISGVSTFWSGRSGWRQGAVKQPAGTGQPLPTMRCLTPNVRSARLRTPAARPPAFPPYLGLPMGAEREGYKATESRLTAECLPGSQATVGGLPPPDVPAPVQKPGQGCLACGPSSEMLLPAECPARPEDTFQEAAVLTVNRIRGSRYEFHPTPSRAICHLEQ